MDIKIEQAPESEVVDAVVVGAGFGGLYAIRRLRDDLGLTLRVFEAADDVGGTWHWNRYPGARCDSDGFVYCYSFSEELLQEWEWKGKYPEQPELRRYLQHVADRFDLRRSITFATRVTSAHFDEVDNVWHVTTDRGETVTARYFVPAIGSLTIAPFTPDFEGLDSFQGDIHHTARWPDGEVSFAGKRVGIIGTGSSGVQSIPVVAQTAEHLTVFQRTPQYSIPARHETVSEAWWADVKAHYGEIWDKARTSAGGFPWEHNGRRALDVSEEERRKTYEDLWQEGGIKFALGSFRDISYDYEANKTVSDFMREKIREVVKEPETAEKLVPTIPFWARRPIVDTHYFETYNRDNVTLVDVKQDPIVSFTASGIRTGTGEIPLDMVIFATGFDAVTGPYFGIDIRGRDGVTLRDHWNHDPSTYLGLAVAGFPNMFTVQGPGSTNGNLPLSLETHVEWIVECIAYMREHDLVTMEASVAAEEQWAEHVQESAGRSMLQYADSWMNGGNIPGKPKVYLFYLGHFGKYRHMLRGLAERRYPGFLAGDGREAPRPLTDETLSV